MRGQTSTVPFPKIISSWEKRYAATAATTRVMGFDVAMMEKGCEGGFGKIPCQSEASIRDKR
jgi:hypothetical protein